MTAPNKSSDFNLVYRSSIKHWVWSDVRIPQQLKNFIAETGSQSMLELGCGVGRFADYAAKQGVKITAVDFSSVAIEKAQRRVRHGYTAPQFQVGDVTCLDHLQGPFDASFDIGCFHCLDLPGQRNYALEVARLLRPGGIHLLWAMDTPPSDLPMTPDAINAVFSPYFTLVSSVKKRRRFASSHWYRLIKIERSGKVT